MPVAAVCSHVMPCHVCCRVMSCCVLSCHAMPVAAVCFHVMSCCHVMPCQWLLCAVRNVLHHVPYPGWLMVCTSNAKQTLPAWLCRLSEPRKKEETTQAVKTLPTSIKEKETHVIREPECESPSPEGKGEAIVGLVGSWQHAAPGHQSGHGAFVQAWEPFAEGACADLKEHAFNFLVEGLKTPLSAKKGSPPWPARSCMTIQNDKLNVQSRLKPCAKGPSS
eukprot:1146484-Pelagomonas_calceolata.AAC.5